MIQRGRMSDQETAPSPETEVQDAAAEAGSEATEASSEKAGLDAFMAHMAKAGVTSPGQVEEADEPSPEPEKAAPARGKDGKFQSKGGQGSEDGAEPEGSRTLALESDKDLEAALHALRRDHYTSDQIDLLGDAEAIKKFAEPLIRKQAADDKAHTKVRELEKALEEATKDKPQEGNGHAPQTQPEAPPSSVSLDKIKASLGDAFGDTDAGVLTEALQSVADLTAQQVAAQGASLGEVKSTLEQIQGVVFEMQMQNVRREAQGRIPDLVDNESWQSVRAQLSKLNPDAYRDSSLEDMVVDAARMLGLGGQSGDGTRRRTSDLNTLKDVGRTGTPKAAPPAPVAEDSGFEDFKKHMAKYGLA